MEESKFKKIQEVVLFNIARARKECSVQDIKNLSGNFLNEKQINNAIEHLKRRNLIKYQDRKNISINLNQILRIKNILGKYWEDNWEAEWKNAVSP